MASKKTASKKTDKPAEGEAPKGHNETLRELGHFFVETDDGQRLRFNVASEQWVTPKGERAAARVTVRQAGKNGKAAGSVPEAIVDAFVAKHLESRGLKAIPIGKGSTAARTGTDG